MNSKVALALKIVVLILVSIAFMFYIIAISTDYWQKTKYKVNVNSVRILTKASQKESQGTYQDLYQYTSSHSGLWRGCATFNKKKVCASIRVQYAWLRSVRAFMALAIIAVAVVFVYVIAAFFRLDLVFKFPGVMSIISALFGLLALAVYTGKSGIPEDNHLIKSVYSWSFIIGWTGWVLNIIAAVLCFIIPDDFEKIQSNKV